MSVSDKGDMQNVQSRGSRGTGLKTTALDDLKANRQSTKNIWKVGSMIVKYVLQISHIS